jgi:hypothetical protein
MALRKRPKNALIKKSRAFRMAMLGPLTSEAKYSGKNMFPELKLITLFNERW